MSKSFSVISDCQNMYCIFFLFFQKIITDEHVLKMVQNSVETGDDGDKDHEDAREDDGSLTFEPKMTRSKVKDFLQKQGSVCIFNYF